MTSSVVRTLRRGSDAAGDARREVRELLGQQHSGEITTDAELVVSELVANAVLHGAGQVTLDLRLLPEGVRIAVADEGSGTPTPVRAGIEHQHGRGVALVELLADSWGVAELPTGGKEVWCVLRSAPADRVRLAGTSDRSAV